MAGPTRNRPSQVLQSKYLFADRWLRLRSAVVAMQDGTKLGPFPIFEHPDWVDVIAVTSDRRIVLVNQYRHAVGAVRTEFPAGTVNSGEEPLAAIKRELLEETGYASDGWHLLGSAPVFPALQTNRIHSFLALGARRVAGQTLDEGEEIHCHELPLAEFIDAVESGTIELPALQLAGLWWLAKRSDLMPLR